MLLSQYTRLDLVAFSIAVLGLGKVRSASPRDSKEVMARLWIVATLRISRSEGGTIRHSTISRVKI